MSGLRVLPLTADRWADLAALFGEGGDPKWCWCLYWRIRGSAFNTSTAASNREALRDLAAHAPAPGLIAYAGAEAVGWGGVGPRQAFERIERSRLIERIDDAAVWSIVCLVVSRRMRGQGVARALIDGAVAYAREHGAPAVEAYPVDTEGVRISSAAAFTGTLPIFLSLGFDAVRQTGSVVEGHPRVIVRRDLSGQSAH